MALIHDTTSVDHTQKKLMQCGVIPYAHWAELLQHGGEQY